MDPMTIAEVRAHVGLSDSLSDRAVRAIAEAEGIQIDDEDDDDGDSGDGRDLSTRIGELRQIGERIAGALEGANGRDQAERDELGQRVDAVLADAQRAGLHTPSRREREPRVAVYDRFDQLGYGRSEAEPNPSPERSREIMRANLEFAAMIFGGTQSGQVRTNPIPMPEDFRRAWQHHVFGDPPRVPWLSDGEGHPTRAMDTAESGFGADLIGTQYVRDLWEAARNNDSIVGRIREIEMSDPTTIVPIDGDLPEMLFVGESTGASATAYATSKTGSSKVTLTAKKFTIQQIWSGELNEDSIVTYAPFLREKLSMAAALYLGSSYYNGDTTNASTGNINSDDADPGDTKHYLAYDGIRHTWLVDATGQGKDMGAAALDPVEITRARGKLNGGDDDVDSLIKNINWGLRPRDLLSVMDWDTYLHVLELDVVKTVDQYGPQATVLTGELGSLPGGIPLVSPAYASKTEADGKASGTESNNTRGQISIFAPRGHLAGRRRDVQLFFDRIQRTDQFLFELYTRRAFTRFSTSVDAGIYNIAVT